MTSSPPSNPFPFISPAVGQDFYGRRDALSRIFEAVVSAGSVAISGPRLMGKSSLLVHVQNTEVQRAAGLGPERWCFARIPCSRLTSANELAAQAITVTRRVLGLRRLQLPPDARAPLDPNPSQSTRTVPPSLMDLAPAAHALRKEGGGLVLLLDDFDALLHVPDAQMILHLTGLCAAGASLVLTSTRDLVKMAEGADLGDARTTYRFRTYHLPHLETLVRALSAHVRLGPLTPEEARAVLREGFQSSGVLLADTHEATILSMGGGHPALLQIAAFVCFDLIATTGELPDGIQDVVGEAASSYLSSVWQSLSPAARARARAWADPTSAGLGPGAPSELDDELVEHSLLDPERGGLFSPLFGRWLQSLGGGGGEEGENPSRSPWPHPPLAAADTPLTTPTQATQTTQILSSQAPTAQTLGPSPATITEKLRAVAALPSAESAPSGGPPSQTTLTWGRASPRPADEAPPAPAPGSFSRARAPLAPPLVVAGLLVFGAALWTLRHTSLSQALDWPDGATLLLLICVLAPVVGFILGAHVEEALPTHPPSPQPKDELGALRSLRGGLDGSPAQRDWASALLAMSSATTLDSVADGRWLVTALPQGEPGAELTGAAATVPGLLEAITREAYAATQSASGPSRAPHLARAITYIDDLEEPSRHLPSGALSDGLWLVSRVWRRILLDAVEGSAGRPRIEASLRTPQVRHQEQVEVEVEITNSGNAAALDVEVVLLSPVGAQVVAPATRAVGTLDPELPTRVTFGLKPFRREPIYLTFQIRHRDPLRGSLALQLNERLTFVDIAAAFQRVSPNPYITGKPVEPGQIFVGRRDDLDFVREAVLESAVAPIILVIGRRRMGKTSLLRHIPGHLGERALCLRMDFQARPTDTLPELLRWMATSLRAQLGDINPDVPAEPFGQDPGRAFQTWAVEPLIERGRGRKLVLLIDELESLFDPLDQGVLSPRFFENMRSLVQSRAQLALVIAGTHRLAERGADVQNVLFGAALTRELSFLGAYDLATLLATPLRSFQIEVAPLAVDRLFAISGGHPLLSQHVCFHLVRRLNQLEIAFVTAEDVEAVIPTAMEGAQDHLHLWWAGASHREKWILVAMAAAGPGARRVADIQAQMLRFGVRAQLVEVRDALAQLSQRDLIVAHGGAAAVTFRQELLRQWVEQRHGSAADRSRLQPW